MDTRSTTKLNIENMYCVAKIGVVLENKHLYTINDQWVIP